MSRISKVLVVFLAFLGILLNTLQSNNVLESFSYYTLQSNLWVLLFFGFLLFYQPKDTYSKPVSIVKFVITVGIMITMVIYHFALRPLLDGMEDIDFLVGDLRDLLLHYFVPLAVLIDFFIDRKMQRFSLRKVFFVITLPLSYLVYTIIYTSFGGQYHLGETIYNYPYFFLDLETYGYIGVFGWSLVIIGLYLLVALILMKMYQFTMRHHKT